MLNHGAQIDDIHILSGGAMVLTVGGPHVRLWDLFTGGTLVNTLSCHAKAVTSAAIDTVYSRLLTAGLDGYVKVHDLLSLQTQGVIRVGTQVLALDVAPDLSRFAVGKADGFLELKFSRHLSVPKSGQFPSDLGGKPPPVAVEDDSEMRGWGRGFTRVGEEEDAKRAAPRPGTYRYFNRGTKAQPDEHATVETRQRTTKLATHDKLLQKFEHVAALMRGVDIDDPAVFCGVVDEVMNRGVLVEALGRLERTELCKLLKFIRKHLLKETYTAKLTLLLDVVLDVHAGNVGMYPDGLKIVESLMGAIGAEIQVMNQIGEIKGGADMLLSVSHDRVRQDLYN